MSLPQQDLKASGRLPGGATVVMAAGALRNRYCDLWFPNATNATRLARKAISILSCAGRLISYVACI